MFTADFFEISGRIKKELYFVSSNFRAVIISWDGYFLYKRGKVLQIQAYAQL